MTRVSLFIDYENIRFGAREVFGDPQRDPYTFGHVKPLRLGLLLKQLGEKVDPERELTAVRVYRVRPGAKSGAKAQAGSARQFAAWTSQPLVTVRSRPLRYQPTAWSMGRPTQWRAEAALGFDEILLQRRGRYRTKAWTTDIIGGDQGQLLDIAPSRTAKAATRWLQQRPQNWLERVRWGVMYLSCPYKSDFDDALVHAAQVIDCSMGSGWATPLSTRSADASRTRSWATRTQTRSPLPGWGTGDLRVREHHRCGTNPAAGPA